ncbi:hypothetical protein K1719_032729 [Acacia pycnantha]|nr:hypothetical protein K1719_032729 [Acacia pycnantha]
MAISSGEGTTPLEFESDLGLQFATEVESEERHIVEAQGGRTNHEDRERDAREGRERQNEDIEEETEDPVAAEEEAIRRFHRKPLTIPVFQCENGHIACSTCCVQLADKCYSCTAPIGIIRCRAIEKVLESLKISCRYARHGCIEKITHVDKSIHEKDCIYTPCWCPIDGCQFTAPSKKLSQHIINNEHHGSFINFIMIASYKGKGKAVVPDLEYLGNVIKVFHIGPKSSAETYRYDLYARSQGCCLKLDSFVNHTLGNSFPATAKFLLVPIDFLSRFPEVNIEIRVYKVYESSRRE